MIIFKALNDESDFQLIFNWLQQPHVKQWWPETDDFQTFVKKYSKKITSDYVYPYLIFINKIPIGMIQYYWFSKAPVGDESSGRYNDPHLVGLAYCLTAPYRAFLNFE